MLITADGNLQKINRAGLQMLEIGAMDPGLAESIYPRVAEEHREALRQLIRAVFNGETRKLEYKFQGYMGTLLWLYTHAVPIRAESGEIIYALATTVDITQRKLYEEKLGRSEANLTKAEQLGNMGHWEWDILKNEITWSPYIYTLHALDPLKDVPTFDVIISIIAPEDREKFVQAVNDAVAGTKAFGGEYRIINREGAVRYLNAAGEVVRDHDGRPISMFGVVHDITERVMKQALLAESEEKYRTLFESSMDGIFILDSEGKFLDANRVSYERLGYTREEFLALDLKMLDYPDYSLRMPERLRQIAENGYAVFPSGHLRKDGTLMPVEVNARQIIYKNHQVLICIIRDITERLKTADEMNMVEMKFRTVFEQAPLGLMILNRHGLVMDCNKHFGDIFSAPREKYLGLNLLDMLPEGPVRQTLRDALDWKSPNRYEGPYRSILTGRDFFVSISAERLGDNLILAIIADITERKHAEERLRESRESFRRVVESSPLSMALIHADGTIEYVNQKAVTTFGYPHQDLPDMERWWVQAYPDKAYREQVVSQWMGLAGKARETNREIEKREYRVTCKDGSVKVCEIFGVWTGDRVLAVFDDITTRKQVEQELHSHSNQLEALVEKRTAELTVLNEQLRQSQKLEAVGLLAGGIAHDFSNILSTIKGSAYILHNRLQAEDPLLKYTTQIASSVDKANGLTQSLLAFSRKQAVSLTYLNLNTLVKKMLEIMKRILGEHIEIDLSLTDQGTVIQADSNHLEQVLLNLATNARDAIVDRGRLTVRTEQVIIDDNFIRASGFGKEGRYVLLSFSDSGVGMSEEVREKIFEPFFTTREFGKGTGLGLAIVYGIVKQHDGYISSESVPGQGTTFRIYFPLQEKLVTQAPRRKAPPRLEGSETILLAEDDVDTRRTMAEVLRVSGYTVLEAADGEEAVDIFSAHQGSVQLLLLDIGMPRMDGPEVYKAVSALRPAVPVLFLSGYTDDIIEDDGTRNKDLAFISKLSRPEEILKKVRELLDKARSG